MKKSKILYILSLLLLCVCAGAQERVVFSLEECKSLALEHNQALRNANLDRVAARAQKNEVFTNYFPVVSMNGLAFHSLDYKVKMSMTDIFGENDFGYNMAALWQEAYPELGANATFNYIKYGQCYGATAVQPVFMGGRIVNGNRLAALGIRAAELKSSVARRDVLEEVERNYFSVTALQEKQKTLDALQELLDSLDKVANVALREGVILKADHMLLQTKRQELENGKLRLRSGLKLVKMALLACVGVKYKVLDLDRYEFPAASADQIPSPEQVYVDEERVVEGLEETQLLDLQVQAKEYEKKLSFGETLPQLALGFSYGYSKFVENNPGRWNGTAFAVVQIPLSDWARNSFKMQRQQVAIDKAVGDRDHLRDMLVLQQRKLYLDLTSAWDALRLSESHKQYNEYLYSQAKLSYDAGYTTVTDLLQAYSSLSEADQRWCNALGDYLTALQAYRGRIPSDLLQ